MTTPARTATRPPSDGARGAALTALDWTIGPVAPAAFRGEYAERRPLLVGRDEPSRFAALLSTEDVERMLCTTALRAPAFRLVKDGAQIPVRAYTQDIPWQPGAFTGTAVVGRVAEEFARGATLVLQALHLHWLPAARYCRALEQELGWPVQANAYHTPASAQGFGVHHDTHDVFVLQLAGRKRWLVYEPVLELPLKGQRWSSELGDPGEPVEDVTLEAGDTLYLPRGWPHEAATADDESLHLTVGLHPPTRLDALRAALDSCADDVEFRRAADPGGVLPDDLLARLSTRLEPTAVVRRARRRFAASRRPILEDQLAQVRGLEGLGVDDRLERRDTVIAHLQMADGRPALVFEGKEVRFPAIAREAVEAAFAATEPFTAAGLPGDLDGESRLVLVRRLVREGFLRATPR